MRLAGHLTDWNDDKGFGFVTPNGGGERAFVHISAFARGSRRPVAGDLISYVPGKDERGRLQARQVRHAGQKVEASRPASPLPRAAIGGATLAIIAALAAFGAIPSEIGIVYVAASAIAWVMYALDKRASVRGLRRTPESTLHLVALLGGWPGALVAQRQFRHKTVKQPFQGVFVATVVLNVLIVGWLVSSGTAAAMLASAAAGG